MTDRKVQLFDRDGREKRKKRTDSLTDVKISLNSQFKNLLIRKAVSQQVTLSELVISCLYSTLRHRESDLNDIRMPGLSVDYQYDNDNPTIHIRIPQHLVAKITSVRIANNCSLRKACFILLIHEMYRLNWIK